MDRICGEIGMVGNLTGGELRTQVDKYGRQRFVGSYRTASVLDARQVGKTTILKARCQAQVYNGLEPGVHACVYVFRTLLRVPLLLGVRDASTGAKTMISPAYYRGTLLQFIAVHAFLNAIGCWIAGMIIGIVIGLGQSAAPPVLGFLVGPRRDVVDGASLPAGLSSGARRQRLVPSPCIPSRPASCKAPFAETTTRDRA